MQIFQFEGSAAAITGAASGIGRALALELAARGCDLALADLDLPGLESVAKEITAAQPRRVTIRSVDVADAKQIQDFADSAIAEHPALNLLFNNAGVALLGQFDEFDQTQMAWLMDINFWGVVRGTRAFLKHLQSRPQAHIVNISSIFGIIAPAGQSAYAASKFAVEGLSLSVAAEVERFGIKTTWFIPGHSIETFPKQMRAVADAGHEIGIHGYSHENPIEMTREQEAAVLDKCIELVTRLSGERPTGYVAPWWEFSTVSNELLLERGIKYDHSLMHNDFTPYYVRVGDSWTKIDYSGKPCDWMLPLKRGHETDLIEIPASWYLDDLPPMMFIKKSPNSHGFVNPHDIEQIWRDQFDWVYREMDYAVFPITIHPDVSGRPQVLMMLERLYAYMIRHPGVSFVTMNEMADDFARRFPRKK